MWPHTSPCLGCPVRTVTVPCSALACAPDRTLSSPGPGPHLPGSLLCAPSHGLCPEHRLRRQVYGTRGRGARAGPGQADPLPPALPLITLLSSDVTVTHGDLCSQLLFTEGARCPGKGLGAAGRAGPRGALTCGRGSSLQRLLTLLLVLLLHHLSGKQQQSTADGSEPRTMWLCVREPGLRSWVSLALREPLRAPAWGPPQ